MHFLWHFCDSESFYELIENRVKLSPSFGQSLINWIEFYVPKTKVKLEELHFWSVCGLPFMEVSGHWKFLLTLCCLGQICSSFLVLCSFEEASIYLSKILIKEAYNSLIRHCKILNMLTIALLFIFLNKIIVLVFLKVIQLWLYAIYQA